MNLQELIGKVYVNKKSKEECKITEINHRDALPIITFKCGQSEVSYGCAEKAFFEDYVSKEYFQESMQDTTANLLAEIEKRRKANESGLSPVDLLLAIFEMNPSEASRKLLAEKLDATLSEIYAWMDDECAPNEAQVAIIKRMYNEYVVNAKPAEMDGIFGSAQIESNKDNITIAVGDTGSTIHNNNNNKDVSKALDDLEDILSVHITTAERTIVASKLGVSLDYLYSWMRAENVPAPFQIEQIAELHKNTMPAECSRENTSPESEDRGSSSDSAA